MIYRNIYVFGEPVLREKARPVEKFDSSLQKLIKRMIAAMKEADGVGLAAPQIGIPCRVIVVDVGEGPFALINPEVIWESEEKSDFDEGCLSFPGVTVTITRPERIRIQYLDEKGNKNILEADSLLARVIQHEIDHLNGVLIIDRATKEQKLEALERLSETLKAIEEGRVTPEN